MVPGWTPDTPTNIPGSCGSACHKNQPQPVFCFQAQPGALGPKQLRAWALAAGAGARLGRADRRPPRLQPWPKVSLGSSWRLLPPAAAEQPCHWRSAGPAVLYIIRLRGRAQSLRPQLQLPQLPWDQWQPPGDHRRSSAGGPESPGAAPAWAQWLSGEWLPPPLPPGAPGPRLLRSWEAEKDSEIWLWVGPGPGGQRAGERRAGAGLRLDDHPGRGNIYYELWND